MARCRGLNHLLLLALAAVALGGSGVKAQLP